MKKRLETRSSSARNRRCPFPVTDVLDHGGREGDVEVAVLEGKAVPRCLHEGQARVQRFQVRRILDTGCRDALRVGVPLLEVVRVRRTLVRGHADIEDRHRGRRRHLVHEGAVELLAPRDVEAGDHAAPGVLAVGVVDVSGHLDLSLPAVGSLGRVHASGRDRDWLGGLGGCRHGAGLLRRPSRSRSDEASVADTLSYGRGRRGAVAASPAAPVDPLGSAPGPSRSSDGERWSLPSGWPRATAQKRRQSSGTPSLRPARPRPGRCPRTQAPRPASTAPSRVVMTPKAASPVQ